MSFRFEIAAKDRDSIKPQIAAKVEEGTCPKAVADLIEAALDAAPAPTSDTVDGEYRVVAHGHFAKSGQHPVTEVNLHVYPRGYVEPQKTGDATGGKGAKTADKTKGGAAQTGDANANTGDQSQGAQTQAA